MISQDMQGSMNLDMSKTTAYKCEECEHDVFNTRYKMRKLSALVSPNGQVSVVPIQIFYCVKCNSRFDIEDIK